MRRGAERGAVKIEYALSYSLYNINHHLLLDPLLSAYVFGRQHGEEILGLFVRHLRGGSIYLQAKALAPDLTNNLAGLIKVHTDQAALAAVPNPFYERYPVRYASLLWRGTPLDPPQMLQRKQRVEVPDSSWPVQVIKGVIGCRSGPFQVRQDEALEHLRRDHGTEVALEHARSFR